MSSWGEIHRIEHVTGVVHRVVHEGRLHLLTLLQSASWRNIEMCTIHNNSTTVWSNFTIVGIKNSIETYMYRIPNEISSQKVIYLAGWPVPPKSDCLH